MTSKDTNETLSLSGLLRDHDEVDALRAENERLRAAVLAYDAAIQEAARQGKQWVDDGHLDDLYSAMLAACRT